MCHATLFATFRQFIICELQRNANIVSLLQKIIESHETSTLFFNFHLSTNSHGTNFNENEQL
jgi:hypothetical protein